GENDDSLLDEWDEIELEEFGLDFGVETDFLMPTRAPRDTPEIAETTARKDSANAAATKAVLANTEEEVIKKIGLADPQYTPTARIWETGDLFVEKSPLSPEEIQQIEDPNI